MNIKPFFIFTLILMALSACGRKNKPEQLDPYGYPHSYPAPITEELNKHNISFKK